MEKKKLNVKSIKQMCSVSGCANRSSYAIARTRYFGGMNICGECLREALALITPAQTEADAKFVCVHCGKVCATQSGLSSHEKACGNK